MQYGYVRAWDSQKGYGFISTDEEQDLFLHVSDLDVTLPANDVRIGLKVKFDVRSDMKGDKAIRVRKA
ncbi:cold shock domain-containing protein [candidate division KSB1 bacterium]|jgi:CspA family cold shock protein|nr:cold shock domain-containing protein [candidate division KSB1 bacterium]